ncbi:cell envelope integrity protein TolA [Bradyrhizobium tropiciagri]|uniref:cell envelope integrity protein TolA n=1 Tax=Bradyrhizobium tropiciagri TaxID=312253 RepID=UPI001BAA22D6|nr:cell envelope integrity protein TolA [Bradyrhizobium tropiciagri]MBR0868922.1 cell envelope integrity protein TolA [Bradyrhizobium tropiciagri]
METLPAVIPQRAAPTIDQGKPEDYFSVERLRRQYNDYAASKDAEAREMVDSRHYYHGDQWTKHEIEQLRRRKQPVVTSNRIVRKIDAVVGLVERLRQDPKAYPRTPKHDEGAELATATLRFVLDNNDWKSKSARIARAGGIDGIAGIEYDLVPGDEKDPSLELHIAYGDGFFYDPRSFDEGFTDARYLGVAKWVDIELAKEIVPNKAKEIDGLMETGTDLTTVNDNDRERNWINTTERKCRLVDHWYIQGGKWKWCLYIGSLKLMEGVSPFIDERGKTFPRYRMFSANVDHDGDRYGFVRNLKSPQDEVNHRRSKALHLLNSRRVVSEKGAVDDIEVARREWAKPDGWVEVNPGLKMEPDDSTKTDFKGQLEMLQEAKNEIENFGPNPALIGQGLEDSSGRAIQLLQQAGIAELGPYLSAYKNWKIRVYRDIWNIIQRYWTAERWIRVTDDMNVAQFFQINKLQIDQFGRPAIVNDIGSLDVDIIIDEGPDAVNMQGDAMMILQSLGPQFLQQFPDIAIELSPLPNSVKKPMLDKINAKMNAPPPPDPKVMALQQKAQLEAQTAQREDARAAAQAQQDMALQARQQQMNEQQAAMDAQLERMKAANDIEIQRMKAAADIEIERIKAANAARMQQEQHAQSMDLAKDKAAQDAKLARQRPQRANA